MMPVRTPIAVVDKMNTAPILIAYTLSSVNKIRCSRSHSSGGGDTPRLIGRNCE